MSIVAIAYASYAAICIGVTIWVGVTLRKNGPTILAQGTDAPEPLVTSMSHLLRVGFYLVNFGAIAFFLKITSRVETIDQAVESLSTKIGGIMLFIAASHFTMLLTFAKIRENEGLRTLLRAPAETRKAE